MLSATSKSKISAVQTGSKSAVSHGKNDKSAFEVETAKQIQRRLLKVYERHCAADDSLALLSVKKTLRAGIHQNAFQDRFILHNVTEPRPIDPDMPVIPPPTDVPKHKISLVPFISALRKLRYNHIRLLFVWGIVLCHEDIVSLALLLDKGSYPIKHLEMIDCSVDGYPLERLAMSCGRSSTLSSLVLDHNDFGDDGCLRLCDGLRRSHKLVSLSVNYCRIGPSSGAALGYLVSTTAITDLYLNGNDLQSQGVTDLVHVLVHQAIKDDVDRREEERRKAVEAIQAAQLERDKKYNYSYKDASRDEPKTDKKHKKKDKKKKSQSEDDLVGPWIHKLHLADNGIDATCSGDCQQSQDERSASLVNCLHMLGKLVMYSKRFRELDLDDNMIGELGGFELVKALTKRQQHKLPSIKLRTSRRVDGDCLATIMTLGGGLKRRARTQEQV